MISDRGTKIPSEITQGKIDTFLAAQEYVDKRVDETNTFINDLWMSVEKADERFHYFDELAQLGNVNEVIIGESDFNYPNISYNPIK